MSRLLVVFFIMLAISAQAQRDEGAQPAAEVTPATVSTQQPEAATPTAEQPLIDTEGSLTNAESPPLNYESSEQISEDLSVSFPVDI